MRFLQKLGFRLRLVFLILCWICAFASIRTNNNWINIVVIVFASISVLGWCIESSANCALKEAETENKLIREMINKCFTQKDDEK